MGTFWEQPSPSDYDRWVERLVTGEEPSAAAKAVGFTCSAFRRTNPERHAEAIELSREARAFYADEKAEEWALEAGADDRMRERWLARWNPVYRKSAQVELTGGVDVRTDIAEAIERFTEAVAAAALRRDDGDGAAGVAVRPVGGGPGPTRLAVARVAGET